MFRLFPVDNDCDDDDDVCEYRRWKYDVSATTTFITGRTHILCDICVWCCDFKTGKYIHVFRFQYIFHWYLCIVYCLFIHSTSYCTTCGMYFCWWCYCLMSTIDDDRRRIVSYFDLRLRSLHSTTIPDISTLMKSLVIIVILCERVHILDYLSHES